MPTANVVITTAWSKVADTADANLLVTWAPSKFIEVASTTADVAPTVVGHRLAGDSAVTRSVIGPGHVWVRLCLGQNPATANLVVSK
jgi:hypothetical protein